MGDRGAAGASSDRWHARELAILNEVARIATEDLELRPLLQRITDALARSFGWEFVACVRVDVESRRFVCEALTTRLSTSVHVGYGRELGSGIVGEVAATGRSILVDDVRTYHNYVDTLPGAMSELCVPVKHRGQVVAILNLESLRLGAFHDQLPLLETLAEQVAGVIANARLYEEVRRRASLLEMLSELSRLALEEGELDALLSRVVRYVHERFSLAVAAVMLVSDDGASYELAAAVGGDAPTGDGERRWPVTAGVVGRAIRLAKPQLALDTAADPDYLAVAGSSRTAYAIPIVFRRRVLGAFNFESEVPAVFSPDNQVVLRLIADQVAGAIHLATVNRRLGEANLQLAQANETLHQLSFLDELTSLPNRRQLDQVLDLEWRRAIRSGAHLALLMIDIDAFKAFNDAYGHQAGDDCLRAVAGALRAAFHRAGDVVARYGGEEFAAVMPGLDLAGAVEVAEQVRALVEALDIVHEHSPAAPCVTVSIGAAAGSPRLGQSGAALVASADRALYQAKHDGRNRVRSADLR